MFVGLVDEVFVLGIEGGGQVVADARGPGLGSERTEGEMFAGAEEVGGGFGFAGKETLLGQVGKNGDLRGDCGGQELLKGGEAAEMLVGATQILPFFAFVVLLVVILD